MSLSAGGDRTAPNANFPSVVQWRSARLAWRAGPMHAPDGRGVGGRRVVRCID
ncbi:MAG TPA: hypothetical protein VKS80_07325 [Trinickia sp.]|nr:hypothetical protein [Trinickia sp.]